jgi:lipopolysaccharide transport system permease protein
MLFGYFLHLSWKDPDTDASVGYIVPFASALLVYLLLTDVVNSSLLLFVSKRNYVQKSPFPIWILWLANLIRAGAHGAVNLAIVLVLSLYSELLSLAGLLWLLPALALIICFCAGLSLVLAVLGPFLSDLSEAARVVMRVLFYAAPVTYPLSIVPERFLWIVEANPMTQLIDPLRRAISFGLSPSILSYTAMAIVSALLCGAGAWMYARLKGAIADVV